MLQVQAMDLSTGKAFMNDIFTASARTSNVIQYRQKHMAYGELWCFDYHIIKHA